ncbi:MAG: CopG family transcriptional regulator [Chloroflexota bacterium]
MAKKSNSKKPLQVYLDQDQLEALRYQADQKGKSMGHLIRESIALYLAQIPVEEDPAMGIVGLGASKDGDLSVNHDQHLIDAFEAQHNAYEFDDGEA